MEYMRYNSIWTGIGIVSRLTLIGYSGTPGKCSQPSGCKISAADPVSSRLCSQLHANCTHHKNVTYLAEALWNPTN